MAFSLVKNNPYLSSEILGAGQLAGQFLDMGQGRRIASQAPSMSYDAYGRPDYNLGQFSTDVKNFQPQGASTGQLLASTGQGAAVGSMIAPGIGTAIGAGVGLIGGAVSGLIGKSKEEEEKRKQEALLKSQQQQYNTGMGAYNQNYLGRQSYEDQLKQYNLPTSYL